MDAADATAVANSIVSHRLGGANCELRRRSDRPYFGPRAAERVELGTHRHKGLQDALLTFFDFPAEHWKHLRTSNVIESPFADRPQSTKPPG
jgi:hypothetical protein